MSLADLNEVHELEKKIYPEPWTFSHFQYEVCSSRISYAIIAETELSLMGYAVAWFVEDEVHIANIATVQAYRKRGIANHLMLVIFDEAFKRKVIRVILEVRENNLAAIHLYNKFGFESIGLRKNYYRSSENAIIMQRLLPQPESSIAFGSI